MSKWPRWIFGVLLLIAALMVFASAILIITLHLDNTPVSSFPATYWVYSLGAFAGLTIFAVSVGYLFAASKYGVKGWLITYVLFGVFFLTRALFRVLDTDTDERVVESVGTGASFILSGLIVYLTVRK